MRFGCFASSQGDINQGSIYFLLTWLTFQTSKEHTVAHNTKVEERNLLENNIY